MCRITRESTVRVTGTWQKGKTMQCRSDAPPCLRDRGQALQSAESEGAWVYLLSQGKRKEIVWGKGSYELR